MAPTSSAYHPLVRIAEFPSGARAARNRGDVVVIVDALRASATITCALSCGARCVRVVGELAEARTFLGRPGCLVAGERGGAKPPDLDLGNSPTEFLANAASIAGMEVVLSTSNGTRCLVSARGAEAVLVGSLPNQTAVVRAAWAIAIERQRSITYVAVGVLDSPAEEDVFAAARLALQTARLGGVWREDGLRDIARRDPLQVFLGSESAARLTALGYSADVRWCAQIDALDVAPVSRGGILRPWRDAPESQ